jgi:hypothetical protein
MDQATAYAAAAPGNGIAPSTAGFPLAVLRTETVLSRFPIHLLAKQGRVAICITHRNAQGEVTLHWDVSYNDRYGPPRQLAYKLDTLVVNRHLEALGRPLPRLIRLGSLRQICQDLGVRIGQMVGELRKAFHQNAGAYIVATLRYRSFNGSERRLEAGFTRYSVVFTGERLPTGQRADAVYLVLNDCYREVLDHAPVRPVDYDYLQALPPTAQRFYELVSYKMFAALEHKQPTATLRYSEYCLFAPQPRYRTYAQVKKQLYKLHSPHLASGYLAQVRAEATTDSDGTPDWWLHYVPGPKARAEYTAFTRQPAGSRGAAPAVGAAPASPAPSPASPATTLVQHFYQRFHGVAVGTPPARALDQAETLLAQHGAAAARFVVDFAWQQAQTTRYPMEHFGGLLPYVPRALAAYETRARQATTRQAAAATRRWQERYAQWRQEAVARLRATLPAADLAALEAAHQARLVAAGTPAYALGLAVRVAVDETLEARAGLPSFEDWRHTQEAC